MSELIPFIATRQQTASTDLCFEFERRMDPDETPRRDLNEQTGVSEYAINQNLPEQLKSSLPSIEQIEAKLGNWEVE